MSDKSLINCSISFDEDGVRTGYLRLNHSVHRSAYGHIPIPIAVAKKGDGPTLLLTGGVHGDEYEGPIVLTRLIQRLHELPIAGRVIIVPSVNQPAYLAGSRVSPIDELNLNRSFPGIRHGTVTQMIAHYVTTELLSRADYAIDMHAGGSSLQYLPTLFAPIWSDPAEIAATDALIVAFAPPRVAFFESRGSAEGDDRVFGKSAYLQNCRFLTGEFGGGSTLNLDGAEMLERGTYGVMAHLGLLRDRPKPPASSITTRRLTMDDPGLFAFAPDGGIFAPAYKLGDEIAAGQLAGQIYDPAAPWKPPAEVHFKSGGLAICIRTFALVAPGDCLGHLAADLQAQ